MKEAASFDSDAYLAKTAAFARAYPQFAPRAYYRAAGKLRDEAERVGGRTRFHYLSMAVKLDQIAADEDARQQEEMARAMATAEGVDEGAGDTAEEVFGSSREAIGTVRQIQHERNAFVQPVRITPSSASETETVFGTQALIQYGGSSGSGQFTGSGSAVLGPVVAQQEAPIIRWEGKTTEAQTVTVAIYQVQRGAGATYPTARDPSNTVYSYRPFFHLFWSGAFGQAFEAYGDVGRGCQFTLACNRLYVNAGMAAPLTGQVPGSMVVGGNFGFFSAARFGPVYRTVYIDNLAPGPGGSTTVIIPILAVAIDSLKATTPGSWTVTVQDNGVNNLFNYSTSVAQVESNAASLGNSAYQLDVTNTGGAPDNAEIVFRLAL